LTDTNWRNYEELATYLLNQFSQEWGLDRFEAKQDVAGLLSGTKWEIDAKGCRDTDGGFMIVECRKYKSKLKQEDIAAIAYRIIDTGAEGAIVVTPIGLQHGAEKVALATSVFTVILTPDSTPSSFALMFLNKFRAGGSLGMFIGGI
jgi:hypothetical protein